MPAIKHYEKYLGLPSFVGRQKKACFIQIKERIWAKMQGWKEKLLSQAGKEVMIKAVIQSIPTYSMSVFRLPIGLIKDIETIIRKFWWGNQDNTRRMQWVKWSTLCSPKSLRGMGFQDLRQFNDALLGKQVWRLYHEKDTLLYKVFKPKYFPVGSILDADFNLRSFFAWKSILQAREVICKGAWWRIGDGSGINIWKHRWLESSGGGQIVSPQRDPSLITVKDLFIPDTRVWNKEIIEQNFLPWEAESIQGIPVSLYSMEDLLIWPNTTDGSYTVKGAYQLMAAESRAALPSPSATGGCKAFWNRIWEMQVPNKVKHFIWRASNESLPTKLNLFTRHILPDNICSLCEEHTEDTIHCLWLCDRVKCIWLSESSFCPFRPKIFRNFGDLVSAVLANASPAIAALFSMVA